MPIYYSGRMLLAHENRVYRKEKLEYARILADVHNLK